jgi:hypothetical protein
MLLSMSSVMVRLQEATRDDLTRLAAEEFGGVSADEAVRRLLAEHWQVTAVAAMSAYRAADPEGWSEYLAEADRDDRASAPVADPWIEST